MIRVSVCFSFVQHRLWRKLASKGATLLAYWSGGSQLKTCVHTWTQRSFDSTNNKPSRWSWMFSASLKKTVSCTVVKTLLGSWNSRLPETWSLWSSLTLIELFFNNCESLALSGWFVFLMMLWLKEGGAQWDGEKKPSWPVSKSNLWPWDQTESRTTGEEPKKLWKTRSERSWNRSVDHQTRGQIRTLNLTGRTISGQWQTRSEREQRADRSDGGAQGANQETNEDQTCEKFCCRWSSSSTIFRSVLIFTNTGDATFVSPSAVCWQKHIVSIFYLDTNLRALVDQSGLEMELKGKSAGGFRNY